MRSRPVVATALCVFASLVPPTVGAQTVTVPDGYFSTLFKAWTIDGCHVAHVACAIGSVVWGQRAGTTGPLGYTLYADVHPYRVSAPSVVFNSLYGRYDTRAPYYQGLEFRGQPSGGYAVIGGQLPEFYVGGLPPDAFQLLTMGLEFNARYPDDPARSGTFDLAFTITPQDVTQVVPEPSVVALVGAGLITAGAVVRRRALWPVV